MGLSGWMLTAVGASAALPALFAWQASPPLVAARPLGGNAWHAIKDPSVVRHNGRWHLFCTVRGQPRSHAVVYLSVADWAEAGTAEQTVLPCHDGYCCAPQVFYFTPQARWYLICQASNDDWQPAYQPAFATTQDVTDPASWSPLQPLGASQGEAAAWLDFWVICDAERAHLFFTSLDGHMWRCEAPLADFPHGWSAPSLALEGDVFEASHTYRLSGQDRYLTVIEAHGGHGWRYLKAYLADDLRGPWQPLAADRDQAFASLLTVAQPADRWTDNLSHPELLRASSDERLAVDPADLKLVFQGVLDADREGRAYGEIPWRLGLLTPAAPGVAER